MKKTGKILLSLAVLLMLCLIPAKISYAATYPQVTSLVQNGVEKNKISFTFEGKDAVSYNVYLRLYTDYNGEYVKVGTADKPGAYYISGLNAATKYSVKVVPVKEDGKESYGRIITACTLIDSMKNLHQDKWYKYALNFNVGWDKLETANGYEWEVKTYKGKKFAKGAEGGYSNSFSVRKISNEMIYVVKVRAYQDYEGKRYYTPWASINCFVQPTVTASELKDGSLYIKWNPVKGASKYVVYVTDKKGEKATKYKKAATLSNKKTNYTIKKVKSKKVKRSKTYYVYVTTVYKNSKSQPVYCYEIKAGAKPREGYTG